MSRYGTGIQADLELFGFKEFSKVLDASRFNRSLKKNLKLQNTKIGKFGANRVKKFINANMWEPNAALTQKIKGHGNTLQHWGIMLKNTGYRHVPWGFEIGTHRISEDGKYNIAQIVHDGAVIKIFGGPKIGIIPPRPFFTQALFEVDQTWRMRSVNMSTQSDFMDFLRQGWTMAIHKAFIDGTTPDFVAMPKL